MKKSLMVALAVCCASCGAKDCNESKSAYEGAYVGAGLSYQHNMHDVWVSDKLRTDYEKAVDAVYGAGRGSPAVEAFNNLGNKIENIDNHALNRKKQGEDRWFDKCWIR